MSQLPEHLNLRFKSAQLWNVCYFYRGRSYSQSEKHKRIINKMLTDGANINYKTTINSPKIPKNHKIDLKDCTPLHFVYYKTQDLEAFSILIKHGADFTVKNAKGQTPLHLVFNNYLGIDNHNNDSNIIGWSPPYDNTELVDTIIINTVLSAHVEFQNSANPRDNNGFSHLHGACIMNHVGALKLFLDNVASVDEAVNLDTSQFGGYTPLHFAAKFNNFDVAQILVSCGANVNAKTAQGMTPLDLVIDYKLYELNCTTGWSNEQNHRRKNSPEALLANENIIKLLLANHAVSAVGLTSFHIACTLKDLTIAESLIDKIDDVNQVVSMQSSLCPGSMALHFAAMNNMDTVKMLLTRGAKLEIEDSEGFTFLDICSDNYPIEDIVSALRYSESWNKIYLSDGKTKLADFVRTMTDLDQFALFLKNNVDNLIVPTDSYIFPGYTIFHLAVIFSTCKCFGKYHKRYIYNSGIVEKCLTKGLTYINVSNDRGQTPIHLAFRRGKKNIVKLLLQSLNSLDKVRNIVDDDNLSYLHIACAVNEFESVKKLLKISTPNLAYLGKKRLTYRNIELDEQIMPGSTPLHVVASNVAHDIAKILLTHGANLHATDDNGLTPIHFLLKHKLYEKDYQQLVNVLFDSLLEKPMDREVNGVGLNYLHVASYAGHVEAIEKLLDLGLNVNATIEREKGHLSKFMSQFSGFTPLHFAKWHPYKKSIKLLLCRGADVFAKISDPLSKLYNENLLEFNLDNCAVLRSFMSVLWKENEMQKIMEEKLGLTKLHIACYLKKEESVRQVLTEGKVNVNSQVFVESEKFAGFTPLHLLITVSPDRVIPLGFQPFSIEVIIELLIEHGADVTIANCRGSTPVHMYSYNSYFFANESRCKDLLLNSHQDFSNNPTDDKGMSHFHLACLWHNVEVVRKFLQQGTVDVNQQIDCFDVRCPGYAPLHLALYNRMIRLNFNWTKLSDTVDLLLKYGANLAVRNIFGDTPLHLLDVLPSQEMNILDKLVKYGADVRSVNIKGEIFLEKRWSIRDNDYLSVLKSYDIPINSWNNVTGEGYIAKIFLSTRRYIEENSEFKKWIQSLDVKIVDKMNRTVIHNSVASFSEDHNHHDRSIQNYTMVIENFIDQDIDINHQDVSGQTALHYAARMGNVRGVKALLTCGADLNIVDNNGKSAFSYVSKYVTRKIEATLTEMGKSAIAMYLHAKKLQYMKLEISQLTENLTHNLEPVTLRENHWLFFYTDGNSEDYHQTFFTEVAMTKSLEIGVRTFTLFDFLNETGIVTLYPYMLNSEQIIINNFFKSVTSEKFSELIGILKLQFQKMTTRLRLIESALIPLRSLLGFSFPGLCEEITRFLTISDLKSLIASTAFKIE